jgi:glycosyltransferase involved in cell wall biosynthesis
MRILLALHHVLDPGYGAPNITLSLGAAFQALGCDVEYLGFAEAFGENNVPSGTWAAVKYPWRVASILRKRAHDFDVFDISSGDNWVWAARGRPGAKPLHALITRSHGLEHVRNREIRAALSAQGKKPSWKFPIYRAGCRQWEVRQSLLRSDMNILGNEIDRAFAASELGVPAGKMVVLPNGIAAEFVQAAAPAVCGPGPVRLAFVGSWIPRKGISTLVESLQLLQTMAVDCRLRILGARTEAEKVIGMFHESVRPRINVIPAFEHTQLPALLAGEEILLFPSRSEGFSMALTEAMACGLAPIATPVGGAPLLIKQGKNGMLIPVDDAPALAAAVARFASDRPALLAIRQAAQSTAREYGWDCIARRTLDLYESVLRTRASRGQSFAAAGGI